MNTDTKPTEFPPKPFISDTNVEFAAKRACALLDIDPWELVQDPAEPNFTARVRWMEMAEDIRKQYAINSALMEAGFGMARIERNL